MIRFGKDICRDLAAANTREWLETNGLGGFASSTITGINTRRYHGLLTAATKPPVGRFVLLSKLEETLIIRGERVELSANQYPGTIHPRGFERMEEFRLDPFPIFTYRVGALTIEKSVFMVQGENTVVVRYKATGDISETRLELRPLIAFRDFHSTTHANDAIDKRANHSDGVLSVTPYGDLPTLYFAHNAPQVDATDEWYRNFEYAEERRRGLDFLEDLYHPFTLNYDLQENGSAVVIASTQKHAAQEAGELAANEVSRRRKLIPSGADEADFGVALTAAAEQFIVQRGSLETIIAGYHWFGDWGRDTMIALPGLTLTTGKCNVACDILLQFAKFVDQGMLPNVFPDAGQTPEYNTADATLWYFEAIRQYAEASGDYGTVQQILYPVLIDIIDWHMRGTRYGIRVEPDGLLHAGEPGVQLTWMDAKVGDWVVTPRIGKPVEIEALWYNALCTMEQFAIRFGEPRRAATYKAMAAKARKAFNDQFWNEAEQSLYDVIEDNGQRDPSIRPNQIFAVGLPFAVLEESRAKAVVIKVESELLTPYGLRTLSPRDPKYIGKYEGDPRMRDASYHQGTVWPWLMGYFLSAYQKVYKAEEEKVSALLKPLQEHLSEAGLGSISEIFCGDAPYSACGCIAQAWSVGEILRAIGEQHLSNSAASVSTTSVLI